MTMMVPLPMIRPLIRNATFLGGHFLGGYSLFELESQCLDILFGSIFSTLSLNIGSHHLLAHNEPAQERVCTAAAVNFRSGSAVWGGLGRVASCHWILLSAGVAQLGIGGLSPRWHSLPGRSALALGLGAQLGLWPGGLVSSPHGHLCCLGFPTTWWLVSKSGRLERQEMEAACLKSWAQRSARHGFLFPCHCLGTHSDSE